MNESHVNGTKQIYGKLNNAIQFNAIQFRFSGIKEREKFFIPKSKRQRQDEQES